MVSWMGDYKNIIVEERGRVFIVTINRPERRNAIDADTAEELYKAWTYFDKNPNLYVGVISGAGGNFSSGADLYDIDRLINRVTNPEGPLGFTRLRLSKPVIAAIGGYCVAGGLEIALWLIFGLPIKPLSSVSWRGGLAFLLWTVVPETCQDYWAW